MKYPGRFIKLGERDSELVARVKGRLIEAAPEISHALVSGVFDKQLRSAVKLFQSRNLDSLGQPLVVDGIIGPLTWSALFGEDESETFLSESEGISAAAVEVAAIEAGKEVRENPRNSNKGERVEEYLASVALPGGYAWCAAFVYWCFEEAALNLSTKNPLPRTAGVLDMWRKAGPAGGRRIKTRAAIENPSILRPGMIFVMNHGRGLGHMGIIERIEGGLLQTIEGNTDARKTREGGGVYRLVRKINSINTGFIEFS